MKKSFSKANYFNFYFFLSYTLIINGLTGQNLLSNDFWIPATDEQRMVSGGQIAINDKGIILVLHNDYTNAGIVKSHLYRSGNNGKSWIDVVSSIPTFDKYFNQDWANAQQRIITSICAVDSVFFILTLRLDGGLRLLRSMDNGKSWELINDSNMVHGSLNASNKSLIIDDQYYTADNSSFLSYLMHANIIESEDYGKTFKVVFQGTVGDSIFPIYIYDSKLSLLLNNYKISPLKYGKRYWKRNGEETIYTAKNTEYENMRYIIETSISYGDITVFDIKNAHLGMSGNVYIQYDDAIYKSTNNGKVFKKISNSTLSQLNSIEMVSCTGNIYISGYRIDSKSDNRNFRQELEDYLVYRPRTADNYINSSFRSTDGGNSWQELNGLDAHILDMALSPDGTIFVVNGKGVYKSSEKECRSYPLGEENLNYGTTIITHGYERSNAPIKRGEWAYNMAEAILEKANGKGCIGIYCKKTGVYNFTGNCADGETILLFNWAKESSIDAHGFSEAAGDALFASLLLGQRKGDFKLENLHFIGHSRGCVVNTVGVERLIKLGVNIDHVTNLDPHDWGFNLGESRKNDDFDVYPKLPRIPGISESHQAVVTWEGVVFSDTYYQKNGLVYANCGECSKNLGLEGREVIGSFNEPWDYYGQIKLCHTNIHNCGYTRSIISPNGVPDRKGGYNYARLAGSIGRPQMNYGSKIKSDFDFFGRLVVDNERAKINRIRSVCNGSFDRGIVQDIPGWQLTRGIGFLRPQQQHVALFPSPSKEAVGIKHNPMYIPLDAESIEFQIMAGNVKYGSLIVLIKSLENNDSHPSSFAIDADIVSFAHRKIGIPEKFRDKVVTIEFLFTGKAFDPNKGMLPVFQLDEVSLEKS